MKIKLHGLFLPGYACTSTIWEGILHGFRNEITLTLVDWPKEKIKQFHSLNNFTDWLIKNQNISQYDFVFGHSMGGLIALQLAEKITSLHQKIILIESFIKSPSPFFKNFVMDTFPKDKELEITGMLKSEKNFYSESLGEQLKNVDMINDVMNLKNSIYAIYGDRGSNNMELVKSELGLDEELLKRIEIHTIHDSCHFPMIENSEEMISALQKIIKS